MPKYPRAPIRLYVDHPDNAPWFRFCYKALPLISICDRRSVNVRVPSRQVSMAKALLMTAMPVGISAAVDIRIRTGK